MELEEIKSKVEKLKSRIAVCKSDRKRAEDELIELGIESEDPEVIATKVDSMKSKIDSLEKKRDLLLKKVVEQLRGYDEFKE